LLEGETKNDQSRVLPLVPELVKLLMALPRREGVFERYNIVSHDDVLDARKQLQRSRTPVKIARALPPMRKAARKSRGGSFKVASVSYSF
jgi:hypothetical protein